MERLLENIDFKNTRELVCLIDQNGSVQEISDKCILLLFESFSLPSSNFYNSCEDKYAKLFKSFLSIVEKNKPAKIILKHNKGGKSTEIEWNVYQLNDDNSFLLRGKIRAGVDLFNLEDKIQENSFPVLVVSAQGLTLLSNKSFSDEIGISSDHLMGKAFKDLLLDKDGNQLHENAFLHENYFSLPVLLKSPNGNKPFDALSYAFEGKFIITLIGESEITSKEAELKKKEEDINAFIYKVSHDFKGPLTSLNGVLDIASDELKDSAFVPFLNMIRTCSDKLEALITTLLELSRVQATPITPANTDLAILVEELKDEIKKQVPVLFENIQISVPDTFPSFVTDVRVFRIALKHILLNAVVFQKKTRQQSLVELNINLVDSYITFEVKDNGLGIPENKMGRIFEMFYKGSDYSVGTGMGLYLAKVAVDRLSGELILTSKQDEGTSVMIKLPQS